MSSNHNIIGWAEGAISIAKQNAHRVAASICHCQIVRTGIGNDNLNVAQVITGDKITGFSNKVTLGDTSPRPHNPTGPPQWEAVLEDRRMTGNDGLRQMRQSAMSPFSDSIFAMVD
jgi:hypothetical protein